MCNAVDTFKQNRRGSAHQVNVTVTSTVTQILARDETRIAIVIGAGSGANARLGLGQPPTATVGLLFPNQGAPLALTLEQHGAIVQEPLYAVIAAGSIDMSVWVAQRITDLQGRWGEH